MKTITLEQAYDILEDAAAVIIDGVVTYPSLDDLTGDSDNQFMRLSWVDEEGQEFEVLFTEGGNRKVKVKGGVLFMTDGEGDPTEVTILDVAKLD